MLAHLREGLGSRGQIVHCEVLPKREAEFGELLQPMAAVVEEALKRKGIRQLFIHQTEAVNAAMARRHVIVATATASGKSLCFNIPVLSAIATDPQACALYLFPTKALAQDQLRSLEELTASFPHRPRMAVYDGDTGKDIRPGIRETANLVITNPDMLHISILPCHDSFQRVLSNLRYVVVDEAHAYKGVFGCHTALILRRLRRVCSRIYNTFPAFILCSATVANPKEHAQELTGLLDISVVDRDGSPSGQRTFVLWNPPTVVVPTKQKKNRWATPEQAATSEVQTETKRASSIVEVGLLLSEAVQHSQRCIAFCGSRKLAELVLTYAREGLREASPGLVDAVRAYRAGYTPESRRAIERELFSGRLRGVAATNALELGVDIGSLDATVHLGFPGSVASLWQQAGRAGRRERPSLAIYVAFDSPLDQYFMRRPDTLFSRRVESAQVDAHNPQALGQHIACAAVEAPVVLETDAEFFGTGLGPAAARLHAGGRLGRSATAPVEDPGWRYIGEERNPAQGVSIRAIDEERFVVVDEASSARIEEIEASKAFFHIYEGAVYLQQGLTYVVKSLDLNTRVAVARRSDVKYYTRTIDATTVYVTGGTLAYRPARPQPRRYRSTSAHSAQCQVTTRWWGYLKVEKGTGRSLDRVALTLPEVTMDTECTWIRIPSQVRTATMVAGIDFRAARHGALHALLCALPLYLLSSPADVGAECEDPDNTRYFPDRLLLFDRHKGGVGVAEQIRPLFTELVQAAMEIVETCPCSAEIGCPGCIQSSQCREYNALIHKKGALMVLRAIFERETGDQQPVEGEDDLLKAQS